MEENRFKWEEAARDKEEAALLLKLQLNIKDRQKLSFVRRSARFTLACNRC